MQRMHYVMHYVMHRVLAKMGWPSLDRVLSKMTEAGLRSYSTTLPEVVLRDIGFTPLRGAWLRALARGSCAGLTLVGAWRRSNQNSAVRSDNGINHPKSYACADEGHMGSKTYLCKYIEKVGM